MPISDLYSAFELEYANIVEEENYNRTNFDESMPLSQFMEGHGAGFSITDDFKETQYDTNGVEQELRGFHEEESGEPNIYVQEILDTVGPDSDEGAGPFDCTTDFHLADYIMFREELRGKPFVTWEKDDNGNSQMVKHPNVIQFGFSPVEAIQMAQEVFRQTKQRTEDDHWTASNRAVQIFRAVEKKNWDEGFHKTYLAWAFRNLHVHMDTLLDDTTGFEYRFEPITDSQDAVIDRTMTRQQADDLSYHEGEQERIKQEGRYWEDVFGMTEDGKWEKKLCSEEFTHRRHKKEERELRTQSILAWIARNDAKKVSEAFGKKGIFQKTLRESRTVCLTPTGSYRTTFKSPIEVWLTKPQADQCIRAAEEKINNSK